MSDQMNQEFEALLADEQRAEMEAELYGDTHFQELAADLAAARPDYLSMPEVIRPWRMFKAAWEVSRKRLVIELPAPPAPFYMSTSKNPEKPIYSMVSEGRMSMLKECAAAIEAQGVTVKCPL